MWDTLTESPEMENKSKAVKQGNKEGGTEGEETVQALLAYIMLCLFVRGTLMIWLWRGARSGLSLKSYLLNLYGHLKVGRFEV